MNLKHEAHRLPPAATFLMYFYHRYLHDQGWELDHKRDGYNSFYLHRPGVPGSREFHIRWRRESPFDLIIYDRYYLGSEVARLRSEDDVARFCVGIVKDKIRSKLERALTP